MSIREKVLVLKAENLNCSQAVLCSLDEYTGMDRLSACSVAAAYGGGVRAGEMCGAMCAASMAFGMATGDGNGKKGGATDALQMEFLNEFKKKYGAYRCEDLVAALGDGEGCEPYIQFCAELAEKLICEYNALVAMQEK